MTKNLKLTFILYIISFSLIIAWNSLLNFFGGVGLTFAGMLVLLGVIIVITASNKEVYNRTKDLLISVCIFDIFEFVVYFVLEFGLGTYHTFTAFCVFQSVLALFAILFMAYLIFRFACEQTGKKIGFIEILLGNVKVEKKEKKEKEVSNGSLEAKPNETKPAEVAEEPTLQPVETEQSKETENTEM